jgi:hypothetical protein
VQAPVIVLGSGSVVLPKEVLREPEGADLEAIEALLARSPRAVVVSEGGARGFFRASLALERGARRVVVRRGLFDVAWLGDLAARAASFGAEVFEHDDARGYARVQPGKRVSVGAPDARAWAAAMAEAAGDAAREAEIGLGIDASWEAVIAGALLLPVEPYIAGLPVHLEEVAFANGDKPVLYLVVPAAEVAAVAARFPGAAMAVREEALAVQASTGRRAYGAGGEASAHVFVAREASKAERAAVLWAEGSSRNVTELGALMGYPDCCTAAFAALDERGNNAALVYVTAARTRALGAAFHPLLNVAVRRVVPFVPCSFGCPRAVAWAGRVVTALPTQGATVLRRALERPVFYLDEARALVLEGARRTGEAEMEFAAATFIASAVSPEGTLGTRARRIFGALLARGGHLRWSNDSLVVRDAAGERCLPLRGPGLGVLLPFGA